jgi:hypothetical protein
VPCIDPRARRAPAAAPAAVRAAAGAAVLLLAACGSAPRPPSVAVPIPDAPLVTTLVRDPSAVPGAHERALAAAAAMDAAPRVALPAPVAAADWEAFRLQAARRIVAASPHAVYDGPVPDPLLAIPVLEVELERDGSVRHIRVLRQPTQARDTVQLAIAAVRRAAPFGPVTQLPKPWKFAEVFLFDDHRRFKPRTLDVD